ncbi:MAG: hypothetical protein HYT46_00785 [Candidatus Vogelbacteria bacterium]|nr:hypothetical protein [Candidatus Vogelbacteria bacterium]
MEMSLPKMRRVAGPNVAFVFAVLLLLLAGLFFALNQIDKQIKIDNQIRTARQSLSSPTNIVGPQFGISVAQTARETAQKLAPENPPRYWQAEKVIFQTDSVWVVLKEEGGSTVGLVIHKSHRHYVDWLGFASTAASRSDNRLTTRLFYVGLADAAHPDSPAAYLSPFPSSE